MKLFGANKIIWLFLIGWYYNLFLFADSLSYYKNKIIEADNSGEYFKSEYYGEKMMELTSQDSVFEMINALYILGTIKLDLLKINEAKQFLEEALNRSIKYEIEPLFIAKIYGNLGILYLTKGEYEYAIRFYNRSMNEMYKSQSIDDETKNLYLELFNYNTGLAYFRMQKYDKALLHFKESLKHIQQEKELESVYALLMIAKTYNYFSNSDSSNKYFDQIEKIGKKNKYNHAYFFDYLYEYANYLLLNGFFEKGLAYYQKSLKNSINFFGEKSSKTAKALMGIGEYYRITGNLDEALNKYEQALYSLFPSSMTSFDFSKIQIEDINDNLLYIDILKNRSKALHEKGVKSQNNSILSEALENYNVCIKIIDYIKVSYQTEESKLFLAEKEKSAYVDAMNEAYHLYSETQETKYIEMVFQYSEKIKSSVLISSIRENEALQISGIPKKLLLEEQDIKREISVYEGLLYSETKSNSNNVKIKEWENHILDLRNRYNKLKEKFEKEYPNYYALKYDSKVIGPGKVMEKLKKDQVMLEYTMFDSILYIGFVSASQYIVKRLKIDDQLYADIENIKKEITNTSEQDFWATTSFDDFYKSTNRLYNLLIKPFEGMIEGKSLIIVPDEKLAGIPFEILSKHYISMKRNSFYSLPLLIKCNPICYAYSATLLFNNNFTPVNNHQLLSFAPEYNNKYHINDPEIRLRVQYDTILLPLPGARDEVKNISKLMKSKTLVGNEATEGNFKMYAGRYKILHLATHTIVDNEKPLYSKIVFASDTSEEDGLLNTFELYNLKLNADMVFLSSCQSGAGKMIEGEGIMSLARGFSYAGCKSIVFTLWNMNDASTSMVVKRYYKYLLKGYSKDKAFQKAKIDYLNSADLVHQHPWFWAGVIVTGDPENIFKPFYIKWILIIPIALLLIVIFYKKIRRHKISGSQDHR